MNPHAPLEHSLLAAADRYARGLAGVPVAAVQLTLADGAVRSIRPGGWAVAGDAVTCDGRPVEVPGAAGTALRVLAAAAGPVALADLRRAWPDWVSEADAYRAVADLRRLLRLVFGADANPVPESADGFRLA